MKKTFGIMLTLLIAAGVSLTCVFAAEYVKYSKNFIKHFKDCDAYSESTSSEFEGESFETTRKIIGWRNGMCKFQETLKSSEGTYQVDCAFPSVQVDELYEAMTSKSRQTEPEKMELEIFNSKTDPKTGKVSYYVAGTQTIKGNRGYLVWTKYENNPYFCKPKKL